MAVVYFAATLITSVHLVTRLSSMKAKMGCAVLAGVTRKEEGEEEAEAEMAA